MLEPIPIPTLQSNYVWLLPIEGRQDAYIIDPGEAGPVLETLATRGLNLVGILITHHHWDHTDGLDDILAHSRVPVYGPKGIRQVDHPLEQGDHLELDGWAFDVLAVPGHTLDHIAYVTTDTGAPTPGQPRRLFCGDALFAGGCGRVMEGSPEQSMQSLETLDRLPAETLVYCAHEYTTTNLRFAREVDPDNHALEDRLHREQQRRDRGEPTLPSVLALERDTNPFLRTQAPAIRAQLGEALPAGADALAIFTELRRRRDRFR